MLKTREPLIATESQPRRPLISAPRHGLLCNKNVSNRAITDSPTGTELLRDGSWYHKFLSIDPGIQKRDRVAANLTIATLGRVLFLYTQASASHYWSRDLPAGEQNWRVCRPRWSVNTSAHSTVFAWRWLKGVISFRPELFNGCRLQQFTMPLCNSLRLGTNALILWSPSTETAAWKNLTLPDFKRLQWVRLHSHCGVR